MGTETLAVGQAERHEAENNNVAGDASSAEPSIIGSRTAHKTQDTVQIRLDVAEVMQTTEHTTTDKLHTH